MKAFEFYAWDSQTLVRNLGGSYVRTSNADGSDQNQSLIVVSEYGDFERRRLNA